MRTVLPGETEASSATVEREPIQSGPYLLQTVNLVLVYFLFDADAVRAVLPAELEPAADNRGFALFYTSASSNSLPPSTAFYVGVFLKGRDAPDGSPGIFVADGYYYSNEASLETSKNYSTRFNAGWAEIEADNGVITGRGGPTGEVAVEFTLRRYENHPPLMLGTHQYFGERPGGLTTYSLAFAARLFDCETVSFRVSPTAPPILKLLTSTKVIRANYVPGAPLNFSKPRPIASYEQITSPDAAHIAVVDVLSTLGRGAVVVGGDGQVFFSNPQGRDALGPLVKSNRLEASDHEEQRRLRLLIHDAAHATGHGIVQRMALHRSDGELLIVQAANYRGGWNGHPTALLVVSDPRASSDGNATQGLEFLGLTPAEAKIAGEVGRGCSAREAATALGLTENTVRSALKLIYAKLGISNRTELANILAQV